MGFLECFGLDEGVEVGFKVFEDQVDDLVFEVDVVESRDVRVCGKLLKIVDFSEDAVADRVFLVMLLPQPSFLDCNILRKRHLLLPLLKHPR